MALGDPCALRPQFENHYTIVSTSPNIPNISLISLQDMSLWGTFQRKISKKRVIVVSGGTGSWKLTRHKHHVWEDSGLTDLGVLLKMGHGGTSSGK